MGLIKTVLKNAVGYVFSFYQEHCLFFERLFFRHIGKERKLGKRSHRNETPPFRRGFGGVKEKRTEPNWEEGSRILRLEILFFNYCTSFVWRGGGGGGQHDPVALLAVPPAFAVGFLE